MEHGHNFLFAHGPQYTVLISWQVAPLPLQCTSSADGGIWGGGGDRFAEANIFTLMEEGAQALVVGVGRVHKASLGGVRRRGKQSVQSQLGPLTQGICS